VIALASNVTKTAIIFGGKGTDLIRGGGGSNIIVGGDGADLIVGGSSRDLLIGGKGTDVIFGNASEDILVAGYTSYDNDPVALKAILAEWTGAHPFLARVNNLKDPASASTDRLNGDYFLNYESTRAGDVVTVWDDGNLDILTGNAGTDWFLFNKDTGVRDWVMDLNSVESQYAADLDRLNI